MFFPEAAFQKADPFLTPPHIKPEWYFLWAYQTLKIFPSKIIGLGVQVAFMTFLALLPFIDRGPERRPAKRPLFVTCYVLGILLFSWLFPSGGTTHDSLISFTSGPDGCRLLVGACPLLLAEDTVCIQCHGGQRPSCCAGCRVAHKCPCR